MHVTYSFHNVLSRGADFHKMMSELKICKLCVYLALFGGTIFYRL
jgi:hypothetical protein